MDNKEELKQILENEEDLGRLAKKYLNPDDVVGVFTSTDDMLKFVLEED